MRSVGQLSLCLVLLNVRGQNSQRRYLVIGCLDKEEEYGGGTGLVIGDRQAVFITWACQVVTESARGNG